MLGQDASNLFVKRLQDIDFQASTVQAEVLKGFPAHLN
jgi:hypothetical protein